MRIVDIGTEPAQAHILLMLAIDPLVTTVEQTEVDVYVNDVLAKKNFIVQDKLPEIRPWEFAISELGASSRLDLFVVMDSEQISYAPDSEFNEVEFSIIKQTEFPLTVKVVPVDENVPVVVQFCDLSYRYRGRLVDINGLEEYRDVRANDVRVLTLIPAVTTTISPWSFTWNWEDYAKLLPPR